VFLDNSQPRAPCVPVSAKGAAFISSLGQRPRYSWNAKQPVPQARDDSLGTNVCIANRRVESRFQRLFIIKSESRRGELP
jgi:hypothetical protein